jgi:hypothetical protein
MSDSELSAYEPKSNDGEYAQPFRHIQYKRTASHAPSPPCALMQTHRQANVKGGEGKEQTKLKQIHGIVAMTSLE